MKFRCFSRALILKSTQWASHGAHTLKALREIRQGERWHVSHKNTVLRNFRGALARPLGKRESMDLSLGKKKKKQYKALTPSLPFLG